MFDRSPQHDDRRDRREPNQSARQAAEALFAPKPQRAEPIVRQAAPASEAARKPRVLTIVAPAPIPREEPAARTHVPSPKEAVIPAAHVARIRAWLSYGMTADQVAETYGVTAAEVERVLRIA
ncbi:MAG TPA: hypothetical protein VMF32_24015 [Xanthobacteraceae bacterium]|nr:hypothetical protein [Xanthobacteraceae bacterium]